MANIVLLLNTCSMKSNWFAEVEVWVGNDPVQTILDVDGITAPHAVEPWVEPGVELPTVQALPTSRIDIET